MSKPRTKWVVCGFMGGKQFSVPGFNSRFDASGYAYRKGWTEILVIRDCEFVFGV